MRERSQPLAAGTARPPAGSGPAPRADWKEKLRSPC